MIMRIIAIIRIISIILIIMMMMLMMMMMMMSQPSFNLAQEGAQRIQLSRAACGGTFVSWTRICLCFGFVLRE